MSEFIGARPVGTSFIVKNISHLNRTLKFFGMKISPGQQYNLLSLRAVSEEDIRASLLKGDLYDKLVLGEIQIISSDINLLQFNAEQKAFLKAHGILSVSEMDSAIVGSASGIVSTRAVLSALPGPIASQTQDVYCKEVGAYYSFVAGDASTIDSWTVLSATGGSAGRWKLKGSIITLSPIGGSSDDWPTVIGAANALAYKGRVYLTPGTYLCKTKVSLIAGATLVGNAGVTIQCSLGTGVSVFNAPFSSGATVVGGTTLAATPSAGSLTVSLTGNVSGAVVPGAYITPLKVGGLRGMTYTVLAVSGTGPYTVTIDRPIRMPFASGDMVNVYAAGTIPADIAIIGNGTRVTGTFDRAMEIAPGWRCRVEGLVISAASSAVTDLTVSFDIAGFNNVISRVEVDGGGVKQLGISLESNEQSVMEYCKVIRITGYGLSLYDDIDCEVNNCAGWGNGIGLAVTADGNTIGSLGCLINGGSYNSNTQYGIVVSNGSSECVFNGCYTEYNGNHGFLIDGANAETGNIVCNVISRGNALNQIALGTGAFSTRYIGCVASRATGFNAGWNLGASCTLDGCGTIKGIVTEGDPGLRIAGVGTVVTINGGRFTPYYGYALQVETGARAIVSSSVFATTDTTNPVIEVLGEVDLSNVQIATGGTGINIHSGGILRRTGTFDASGCSTAITVLSGGFSNIGTFNLNGTTPVDYNFPVLATDPVRLTRKTSGGTPGTVAPTFTISAGSKVTVTGTGASDTSTYQIEIG